MKRDSRLSGVLHVLLHMAERRDPMTSEALAQAMQTHPVVIRRILGGLRDAGFVRSEKGHGGGWTIQRALGDITMRDIYDAIGRPALMAMGHRTDAPGCLVEQAVNAALDTSFRDAEALLLARFAQVTLAELAADFHTRMAARPVTSVKDHIHG
jgi:Rrf2 family protein